jgi:DNA-binding NarL/FixJ family response regulator
MSVDEAARYALSEQPTIAPPPVVAPDARAVPPAPTPPRPPAASNRRQSYPGGLSKREAEVARLVAAGRTSREIAEALVVSERTVTTHLDHIFAKLGVSSRTAVAIFALRNGLA